MTLKVGVVHFRVRALCFPLSLDSPHPVNKQPTSANGGMSEKVSRKHNDFDLQQQRLSAPDDPSDDKRWASLSEIHHCSVLLVSPHEIKAGLLQEQLHSGIKPTAHRYHQRRLSIHILGNNNPRGGHYTLSLRIHALSSPVG